MQIMDYPIRILHVFGRMDRGGAEAMIMNLLRNIDQKKVIFDFVVHTTDNCAYDEEILSYGCKIFRFPKYSIINHYQYSKIWNKFFDEHTDYHIIHGHAGAAASIYLKIAKNRKIKTIAHSHSAGFAKGIKGFLYKITSRNTGKIADYLFACSELAGKNRYKNEIYHKPFYIFNNGIDLKKFEFCKDTREKTRRLLGIKDELVVGTVGRFEEEKNPNKIIDIICELKKLDENFKFLWVGTGSLFDKVVNKSKLENCFESIKFTGAVGDVQNYMSAMDVFILPSFHEGLPVVLIEAQANGLPIFMSDVITNEVKCTDLVKSMSINVASNEWASNIILSKRQIKNYALLLKQKGYDIKDTSKWLTDFYISIYE